MAKYRLKDLCLFVDGYDYDEANRKVSGVRKPNSINGPYVMNKTTEPAAFIKLNDAAAFITRFLVMGLDTGIIAQILTSEYGSKVSNPATEVQAVVTMLADFLIPRDFERDYQAPKDKGRGNHTGVYELDFRVNWFVTGGFKGPL